jgi:predicted Ser/Thr protein kinase
LPQKVFYHRSIWHPVTERPVALPLDEQGIDHGQLCHLERFLGFRLEPDAIELAFEGDCAHKKKVGKIVGIARLGSHT